MPNSTTHSYYRPQGLLWHVCVTLYYSGHSPYWPGNIWKVLQYYLLHLHYPLSFHLTELAWQQLGRENHFTLPAAAVAPPPVAFRSWHPMATGEQHHY